jgi:acetoacetyl-CoA synthetase
LSFRRSAFAKGSAKRRIRVDELTSNQTGWIMYMSAVLTLLWGGRSVLYDGSPFQPDLTTFMKTIGEQRYVPISTPNPPILTSTHPYSVTNLGTSPKYLHELQKNNLSPREITDLSALRAVTSTGMVLSDSLFEWFYDAAFPPAVHLANIAGGTDLAACFGMENPLRPVYVGGCQGPSLGTKVEVYDSTIEGGPGVRGKRVEDGVPGELVA